MLVKGLDNLCVIELANRIDVSSSPELEKLFGQLLDNGQDAILCDFSKTEYISSMGLRVFLSTLKRTVKTGGQLILCCLNPGVMEIFDMTGLTSLFPVFDSSEAALAFFSVKSPQTREVNGEKKHGEIAEIIIDKQPREVTSAYAIALKQGRMDEKA